MSHTAEAELIAVLPFVRRYARALVGGQAAGDRVVARAMAAPPSDLPPRLQLYAEVSRLAVDTMQAGLLSVTQRQILLLTALEDLTLADAAQALRMEDTAAAADVLATARDTLRHATATDVLIIEDEPVIAMDLSLLLEGCGHRVVGVAASEAEALSLMRDHRAGLILADVNLGRGGNGIVAVRHILQTVHVPVIFVTAYPEQLLTAEGLEPTFVMRKPFDPLTLSISVYQAITAGIVPLE